MLKNSIFQVIANILSAFLNLLIIVFTARTLGAAGRGEITYLIICLGIIQIFTSIVGNSVMIFMLTRHTKQNVLVSSLIWTFFAVLVAIPVVYYVTAMNAHTIIYLVILCVFQTSFSNLITLYSAELKFRLIVLLKTFQPVILLLLIFIFYSYQKFTVDTYWILLIFSFLPHFLLFLKETGKNLSCISVLSLKITILDFLKLGGLSQFTNLMQFASYKLAALIIAKTLPMDNVGVFGLWLSVTDAIWLIPIGLATVNMSYANRANYQFNLIGKYVLASVGISLSLIVVIIVIPNSLYVYILSKDFVALKSLIVLSSPIIVLCTVSIVIAYYFSAKGLIKYNTLSSGLGFITILLSTSYLTDKLELRGAVLANCISYTVSVLTTLFLFFRHKRQLKSQSVSNS